MERNLRQLTNQSYDVIVVGAGIYGATIAWEATLRGLSVVLLEKDDFGHATSANSLKTVHGGLRYLQHLDFKRMRESIRERTALIRIAPHLVHVLPCIMPTYGHGFKGKEVLQAALLLNDLISFDRNRHTESGKHLPNGRLLAKDETLALLSGIDEENINGGAVWYDAQMYNSERLTLAFILSAAERGTAVANYAQVTNFIQQDNRILGVQILDRLTGHSYDVQARMVINAAGPWVDNVLGLLERKHVKLGVRLAKAVNVATRQLFPTYAVGLKSRKSFQDSDSILNTGGRLFFISPWRDQSLIGTTYTAYEDHPDDFEVTSTDIQMLLHEVNSCYPAANLTLADVRFVYQGMVPINGVHPETGDVQRAKQYRIVDHRVDDLEGLISVLGVKYTTARDVAEKVVDQVFSVWNQPAPPSQSATTPLVGGEIAQFDPFMDQALNEFPFDLTVDQLRPLLFNYGSKYENLLRYFDREPLGKRPLTDEEAILRAQTLYAVYYEMAQKLNDVIFRRTELGTSGYPGDELLSFCAQVMGQALGWHESRIRQECLEAKQVFALTPQPQLQK